MHGRERAIVWWRLMRVIEKCRFVNGQRIISVKKISSTRKIVVVVKL